MVAQLSISGANLSANCGEVLRVMRKLNIVGDVTPNMSVGNSTIEPGCRILVCSNPAKENAVRLWEALRATSRLTCAHLYVNHSESGCVFDMTRPSLCPDKV